MHVCKWNTSGPSKCHYLFIIYKVFMRGYKQKNPGFEEDRLVDGVLLGFEYESVVSKHISNIITFDWLRT